MTKSITVPAHPQLGVIYDSAVLQIPKKQKIFGKRGKTKDSKKKGRGGGIGTPNKSGSHDPLCVCEK